MRFFHQSTRANRDSLVIGQNTLFACGISRSVWRTSALHSPHDSEHREKWAADAEEHGPTRLAGSGSLQPHLAESVSATQRMSRACHGSLAVRRGAR